MPQPPIGIAPASLLESFDDPAILLSADYEVLAANRHYTESFGSLAGGERCYEVSHGYDRPCDQAGESCPLSACQQSRKRERVVHVHRTPRGREHIDVEMMPLRGTDGQLNYFIEILRPVPQAGAGRPRMVGHSRAFTDMLEMIQRVAPHDTSVLLQGESGTGKELAATAIHAASTRSDRTMVTVECAGLTETLFESELFGHVTGAFTGAVQNKPGLLEAAEGGTLFLDEIGDVPLGMQVKLLRLLETGCYRPVGSTQLKRADFRLICATHKQLPNMVACGDFRQDLYFRLNTFPIALPPLRARGEDIGLLTRTFLAQLRPDRSFRLSEEALARLRAQPFPGNIRELKNLLERATILADTPLIDATVLARCLDTPDAGITGQDTWVDLATQERRYLRRLLEHCDGDKARAADIAGISLRSLYRRLESKP